MTDFERLTKIFKKANDDTHSCHIINDKILEINHTQYGDEKAYFCSLFGRVYDFDIKPPYEY